MRRLVVALVCFLLSLSCRASDVEVEKKGGGRALIYKHDHSAALLIYASKYRYPGSWPTLDKIPDDIEAIKRELVNQGFRVTIAPNVSGDAIVPTIQDFLGRQPESQSRAIVYYSGHGYTEANGQAYLIGTDAPAPTSQGFKGRITSIGALREIVKESKANHTLLVLDSCYSGALLKTKSPLPPPSQILVEKLRERAVWLLASGTDKQRVQGDSTFAKIFVAGLKGGAAKDPQRRYLTMSELAWWVEQKVPDASNQTPVSGLLTPIGGDMLFVPGTRDEVASVRLIPHVAVQAATKEIEKTQGGRFVGRFPQVNVRYYRKAGDGLSVVDALTKAEINYTALPPQLSDRLKTNALYCSPATPIAAVKEVALALMDGGIELTLIQTFRNGAQKGKSIEIVSAVEDFTHVPLAGPPVSHAQIAALTSCPRHLAGISP
jgi:hypothetical protein